MRIVLAVTVLVAAFLIVSALYLAPSPSGAADKSAGQGTRQSSSVTSLDPPRKPSKLETTKERRARMISNDAYRDDFKLSEQDVYQFVQAKGSNAVGLVAAFEASRDKQYLKTAAEKFPNDPFVQAKVLMWLDLSDEERAKWTEAFKKASPTNSFANFLAAQAAIKRGDTDAAFKEIMAAKDKGYEEFMRESMQGLEDAYLSAGRSAAEAKTLGSAEVTLPHLAQLKGVGRKFLDLAEKAAATGDTKTQQEMLLANWMIGQKLRSNAETLPIITDLVGIAMENATYRAWPAGTDFNGRPAAELLDGNATTRKALQANTPLFDKWFRDASDEEIVAYMDMLKASGEPKALAWLKEQHPELTAK